MRFGESLGQGHGNDGRVIHLVDQFEVGEGKVVRGIELDGDRVIRPDFQRGDVGADDGDGGKGIRAGDDGAVLRIGIVAAVEAYEFELVLGRFVDDKFGGVGGDGLGGGIFGCGFHI